MFYEGGWDRGIETPRFTSKTDPATNAAVSSTIVSSFDGVLVTLTGAGNSQTMQAPTSASIRIFTVVNNDTSTNDLTVVANSVSFTISPGKVQSFIYDGSAWVSTSLGITSIPVTVVQGGTGRVTGTTAYSLVATGTTATGAQQTLANGATTEILVGGGASALPVWTTATGSGAPVRAISPSVTGTLSAENVSIGDAGKITFDIAPAASGGITGVTFSETVGENVSFGHLLYLKSDGKWWKSDASASSTMPGMRMASTTILADAAGVLVQSGIVRNDSWTWAIGGLIYASETGGALTQTPPSADNSIVQVVGYALTATVMVFAPSLGMIENTPDIEAKNSGYTITWAELTSVPKKFTCDSGSDQVFDFAAPISTDVGKMFTLVKLGAGKVTLDCPASIYVDDSTSGGTIYCDDGGIATLTLLLATATKLVVISAKGTWTTT